MSAASPKTPRYLLLALALIVLAGLCGHYAGEIADWMSADYEGGGFIVPAPG